MGGMEKRISAIILKVPYDKTGDTAAIEILGKTMLEWLTFSLSDMPVSAIPFESKVELPILVRPHLDKTCEYTAVLYSDTPLLTKKTVLDAVCALEESGRNLLRMTRGFIFKTAYLASAEKLFAAETHYFDEEDFITAFNFKQVAMIGDILRGRILNHHMERGVQIEDPATTFIGPDVRIGQGVVIAPNNHLRGVTVVKNNVRLFPGNYVENSIIEEGAVLNASQIYKSYIGKGTKVGPYAYIRPESVIGADCRIGDFVEIKKSVIGDGCKVSHLSYVGDCEMGEGCNIGCGVVFVNYDGKDKHRSIVGNKVFIGSNVNVIAPVTIADGAFLAAGSTINRDVESGALAIARERQRNIPGWQGNKFVRKEKETE
jgi:bifunctional N-acetylglucosamine-1-phosphate-uridyltransferase/glucosamine-1-phosphate-acetyltransferase GlmU-like protein